MVDSFEGARRIFGHHARAVERGLLRIVDAVIVAALEIGREGDDYRCREDDAEGRQRAVRAPCEQAGDSDDLREIYRGPATAVREYAPWTGGACEPPGHNPL